jgi:uncharacterized protein (DUF924 family)
MPRKCAFNLEFMMVQTNAQTSVQYDNDVERVLDFWFPATIADDDAVMRTYFARWFGGSTTAQIKQDFVPLLELAAFGALNHWAHFPHARLALIIVLDQFSRSAYNGSARMYAQDERAIALASEGLYNGHYDALRTPWEKIFFIMPFGHSESLLHLNIAVQCADELVRQATPNTRLILEHSAAQARAHREVVQQFGRQPHRNPILDRISTPEELAYIERGEFVHQRKFPQTA